MEVFFYVSSNLQNVLLAFLFFMLNVSNAVLTAEYQLIASFPVLKVGRNSTVS